MGNQQDNGMKGGSCFLSFFSGLWFLMGELTWGIIFMNLRMPGMGSYQALKEDKYRHTPIVAPSADIIPNVMGEVITSGLNDYLSKPFTQNTPTIRYMYTPRAVSQGKRPAMIRASYNAQ